MAFPDFLADKSWADWHNFVPGILMGLLLAWMLRKLTTVVSDFSSDQKKVEAKGGLEIGSGDEKEVDYEDEVSESEPDVSGKGKNKVT